jgi:LPS-assembly protein
MRFLLLALPLLAPTLVQAEPEIPPVADAEIAELPMSKCYTTAAKPPEEQQDLTSQPLHISAGQVSGDNVSASFQGQVQLTQGSRNLTAEKISVNKVEQTMHAEGGIHYEDGWLDINGQTLSAELESASAELTDADYQFEGQLGRGVAKRIKLKQGNLLSLDKATFTTCPPGDNSWQIEADEIVLNGDEEWGESWGTWMYVKDVPVLYVPYFTFPISNTRKTGLLFPTIGSSSDSGFEMSVPWYWNIAPDMDATITPRYMSERGTQLLTEYRYLTEHHYGQLNYEYLDKDDKLGINDSRTLLHWQNQSRWNKHLRGYLDFTTISDDNYLNDLGSEVASSTDNRLQRTASIAYLEKQWRVEMRLLDYEELGDSLSSHRMLPALEASYSVPELFPYINFDWYSEAVYFDHRDNKAPTTTRLHLEPTLSLPLGGPSYTLLTEAKLYQTFYNQNDKSGIFAEQLDKSVSRTLPSFRILGSLNFEREAQVFDTSYLQVLEPKVQYLYVPHEEQDQIFLYDTNALQYDYDALFRSRRYIGLDRIADANQLTVGASTRFINDDNQEKLRFSLGQIFYFEDSSVDLFNDRGQITESHSAVASELDFMINENWYLHNELQFDTKEGRTTKNAAMINYQLAPNKRFQINHRYLPDIAENQKINQLGLLASWPLQQGVQVVGSWYKDLEENRSIESYLGLQFESCCYAVRFGYHRHLNTNFPDGSDPNTSRDAFDSGVWLSFMIKGFGGGGNPAYQEMEADSVFGDLRNEYINN